MKRFFFKRLLSFWNSKIPPLLSIIYYLMYLKGGVASNWLSGILWLMIAAICFGLTGYLLNDWADIEENRRQGRSNLMGSLSAFNRWWMVLFTASLGFVAWYFIWMDRIVFSLLVIQMLCYISYSFPPFRIKEKGLAGLVLDSIYAHVLPATIVIYAFSMRIGVPVGFGIAGWLILMLYFGIVGVRNIIMHQISDFEDDNKAGTKTFVVSNGIKFAARLKNRVLVPVEILLMLALFFALPGLRDMAFCYLGYVFYVFFREVSHLRRKVMGGEVISYKEYDFLSGMLLNEFNEKWLPLLFLGFNMMQFPLFKLIIVGHLIVFLPNTIQFYSDYRFIFWLIILPVQLAARFIYHHGLLKAFNMIYYNIKHWVYWYVYMPVKRMFVQK